MATRAGKRHSLLVYKLMMDRWWSAVFALGLASIGFGYVFSRNQIDPSQAWRWLSMMGVGIIVTIAGLLMFAFRKAAYVQAFGDHLRLVTPFLRLNISYKRIRRTATAQMSALFPPKSLSNWRAETIEPLSRKTAVVVELNGFPTTQTVLRFFLSPFFFKDASPHFVLLVEDWMRFSTEIESFRTGTDTPSAQKPRSEQSILSRLPHK